MDWSISWWVWLIAGFALALLELTTPGGFYFLFFGIAALAVGLLSGVGIIPQTWLQLMVFSVLAVAISLLFRKPLLQRFGPRIPEIAVDSLVGETATALADIDVNAFGKVELRGSAWSARNTGTRKLSRGDRCTVERVEGLSVWIRG
jgi:membrane protein implicated in regulation of membrane protease activity